jgi:serine/threonine-protein kinase
LIHRDVKPANLYACRYGREVDFMKVLDFGLVKTREPDGPVGSSRPGRQVAGGTPAFMSPEQVLGDEAIDARTDIYALGCVAYWLLTGQPVFTGTTPMDTMMKQVSVEPEPPSKRTAQPIPPELEAIVMRCLAKESAHRPQSADELRELLEAVPLRDRWTEERAQDWWNSRAGA